MITEGSGKDVLLLHGYLSCKESFYYQINFLSKYYKVTAPDMPGFGASPPLDSAYAVGNYAEWLKEFIKKAEMETPHGMLKGISEARNTERFRPLCAKAIKKSSTKI